MPDEEVARPGLARRGEPLAPRLLLAILTGVLAVIGSMTGALIARNSSDAESTRSFARTQSLKDYTAFIAASSATRTATYSVLQQVELGIRDPDDGYGSNYDKAIDAWNTDDDKESTALTQLHLTASESAYSDALKVLNADGKVVQTAENAQTVAAVEGAARLWLGTRPRAETQFVPDARSNLRPQ